MLSVSSLWKISRSGRSVVYTLSVRCWCGLAVEACCAVVDWNAGWELRKQALRRERESPIGAA